VEREGKEGEKRKREEKERKGEGKGLPPKYRREAA